MTDPAVLQTRLAEAEEALHLVELGQSATVISYDGHRTEYTPANAGSLRRYIAQLNRKLDNASGPSSRRVVF